MNNEEFINQINTLSIFATVSVKESICFWVISLHLFSFKTPIFVRQKRKKGVMANFTPYHTYLP